MPALGKVAMHQYDLVLVDEAQDLNAAQQAILEKLVKPDGRLVAVGDPHQAIYGFAGADHQSFDKLCLREHTSILPLSDCYRCGKHIISLAQTIVPHINAYKGNGDGKVRYGSYMEVQAHDLVLCRFNAPMLGLCFEYIRQGKKAVVKGKDISTSLLSMIKKHKHIHQIGELLAFIEMDLRQLLSDLMKKGNLDKEKATSTSRYIGLADRFYTLKIIADQCETNNVEELKEKVDMIFDEKLKGIMLSSIHKAKGLEADRIFILGDDFAPAAMAKQDWEKEQEDNLIYVAYTRPKKELVFINDYEQLITKNEDVKMISTRYEDFLDNYAYLVDDQE